MEQVLLGCGREASRRCSRCRTGATSCTRRAALGKRLAQESNLAAGSLIRALTCSRGGRRIGRASAARGPDPPGPPAGDPRQRSGVNALARQTCDCRGIIKLYRTIRDREIRPPRASINVRAGAHRAGVWRTCPGRGRSQLANGWPSVTAEAGVKRVDPDTRSGAAKARGSRPAGARKRSSSSSIEPPAGETATEALRSRAAPKGAGGAVGEGVARARSPVDLLAVDQVADDVAGNE